MPLQPRQDLLPLAEISLLGDTKGSPLCQRNQQAQLEGISLTLSVTLTPHFPPRQNP